MKVRMLSSSYKLKYFWPWVYLCWGTLWWVR